MCVCTYIHRHTYFGNSFWLIYNVYIHKIPPYVYIWLSLILLVSNLNPESGLMKFWSFVQMYQALFFSWAWERVPGSQPGVLWPPRLLTLQPHLAQHTLGKFIMRAALGWGLHRGRVRCMGTCDLWGCRLILSHVSLAGYLRAAPAVWVLVLAWEQGWNTPVSEPCHSQGLEQSN